MNSSHLDVQTELQEKKAAVVPRVPHVPQKTKLLLYFYAKCYFIYFHESTLKKVEHVEHDIKINKKHCSVNVLYVPLLLVIGGTFVEQNV